MTKQLRFSFLLVVVISATALSAPTALQLKYLPAANSKQKINADEKAIQQVERELETALLKGDSATLDRILADDYVEIDAQGGVKKKADVLALARARRAVPRAVSVGPDITVDGLTIRIHGDSAAVVGRTTIRYLIGGCNSGVPNTLFTSGCTISDLIAHIAATSRNHGKFVSGVAHLGDTLVAAGIITSAQKDAMQSCAAGSRIP